MHRDGEIRIEAGTCVADYRVTEIGSTEGENKYPHSWHTYLLTCYSRNSELITGRKQLPHVMSFTHISQPLKPFVQILLL